MVIPVGKGLEQGDGPSMLVDTLWEFTSAVMLTLNLPFDTLKRISVTDEGTYCSNAGRALMMSLLRQYFATN